jgi:hypothetical protein
LADQDIRPRKALANGFTFLDADIGEAMHAHLRAAPQKNVITGQDGLCPAR